VQFIGGEPTLHPALPSLVLHAVARGLGVEVYSNLARPISERLWSAFEMDGVRLATSYHAATPVAHDEMTARRGSHRRTRANIIEARRRGIPLRAGVVSALGERHAMEAVADLRSLGVTDVRVDRMREIGRGSRGGEPDAGELCGRCADGTLAVLPSGAVVPCVMARWLNVGDVRASSLSEVNEAAEPIRADLRSRFTVRADCDPNCTPKDCDPVKGDGKPGGCDPDYKDCGPWEPKK